MRNKYSSVKTNFIYTSLLIRKMERVHQIYDRIRHTVHYQMVHLILSYTCCMVTIYQSLLWIDEVSLLTAGGIIEKVHFVNIRYHLFHEVYDGIMHTIHYRMVCFIPSYA